MKDLIGITLQGFKSYGKAQFAPIKELTVLAGANSSGKSSIMHSLLLLKQTLDESSDSAPLLLHGSHVKFTNTEQVFFKGLQRMTFTLHFADAAMRIEFGINDEGSIALLRNVEIREGVEAVYEEGVEGRDAEKLIPESLLAGYKSVFSDSLRSKIRRNKFFLSVSMSSDKVRHLGEIEISPWVQGNGVAGCLRSIIHVPGLRVNAERSAQISAVGKTFPATFDRYVASILLEWNKTDKEKLQTVGKLMQRLGLTWKVEANKLNEANAEIEVGRMPKSTRGGARDLVNIADVGFGTSQVLPVLIALTYAEPGRIVLIEQPELHLHPRAQLELASVIAEAVKRGVRVVLETHSGILIRGIQAAVASEVLQHVDVSLLWFSRGVSDGSTQITAAELDEKGRTGKWPADFDEVDLQAQAQFLKSATS